MGLETQSTDGAVTKSGAVGAWPEALSAPAAAAGGAASQLPAAPRKAGSFTAAASSSCNEGVRSPLPFLKVQYIAFLLQNQATPSNRPHQGRVDPCKMVAVSDNSLTYLHGLQRARSSTAKSATAVPWSPAERPWAASQFLTRR